MENICTTRNGWRKEEELHLHSLCCGPIMETIWGFSHTSPAYVHTQLWLIVIPQIRCQTNTDCGPYSWWSWYMEWLSGGELSWLAQLDTNGWMQSMPCRRRRSIPSLGLINFLGICLNAAGVRRSTDYKFRGSYFEEWLMMMTRTFFSAKGMNKCSQGNIKPLWQ